MRRRLVLWSGLSVAILLVIGGGWLVSLPSAPAAAKAPPVPQAEVDATLVALKPPKRARPVVAIIGINDGTETTDYLMPYGILRRADIADVTALATSPGPVTLYPALKVQPDATIADFDARHPDGADYVIVPAMRRAATDLSHVTISCAASGERTISPPATTTVSNGPPPSARAVSVTPEELATAPSPGAISCRS